MKVNPIMSVEANYGEVIHDAVKDLGTGTPHIQVLKLVSRTFGVALADVRADCQEYWLRLMHRENDKGGRSAPPKKSLW